jgi:hypothetical protein
MGYQSVWQGFRHLHGGQLQTNGLARLRLSHIIRNGSPYREAQLASEYVNESN